MTSRQPTEPTISRAEWDRIYDGHFGVLFHHYPEKDPGWRRAKAHERTGIETGVRHRPPGMLGIVLRTLAAYLKGGGNVEFNWSKNAWKGLRAALGLAAAAALYSGGELLLSQFDTPEELAAIGAPAIVIPLLVALGAMARNYIKQRRAA